MLKWRAGHKAAAQTEQEVVLTGPGHGVTPAGDSLTLTCESRSPSAAAVWEELAF